MDPQYAQIQIQQQHQHGMNCATGGNVNKGNFENNKTNHLVTFATVTTKEIKMVTVTPKKTPSV